MIPKNIHLVFLRKDEFFPELFGKCMKRIEEQHPTWNVFLYDENDAQRILQEHLPNFVNAYNSFKHNIQKADFLRLALVYIFGGFYMDLDMLSLKSLDELTKYKLVLGEEKTISEEEQKELNLKYRLRIGNYMFGGIANHPFWLLLLSQIASKDKITIKSQQDVLDITGPGLLTDTYLDNKEKFPDIVLLQNTDKRCLNPLHNEISCHFGEYAAHLHAGTWRKEI